MSEASELRETAANALGTLDDLSRWMEDQVHRIQVLNLDEELTVVQFAERIQEFIRSQARV